MPRVIVCEACNTKLKIPDQFTATKAKCPRCGGLVAIPGRATPAATTPPRPKPVPQPAAERVKSADDAGFEVIDEEEPQPKKKKASAPLPEPEADERDEEPAEEEDRPRKKKKKRKKKRRPEESHGTPAWVWWAVGLAGLLLFLGMSGVGLALAGHGALVLVSSITLAIMVPVSMVILIVSMILSSALAGGISFGEVHLAILKSAILLIVVNLISLIPWVGIYLALPVWLFGVMIAFDLDLWEAKFLVFVNWFLNYVFSWLLLAMFLSMLSQGRIGPGDLDDFAPDAEPATQQEKAMEAIEKLGGEVDDDENADDIRIIGVSLADTRAKDADLALLKSFPALVRLDLSGTSITDRGLERLKELTQLQVVTLKGTKVTPEGIAELQKALPQLKIIQ